MKGVEIRTAPGRIVAVPGGLDELQRLDREHEAIAIHVADDAGAAHDGRERVHLESDFRAIEIAENCVSIGEDVAHGLYPPEQIGLSRTEGHGFSAGASGTSHENVRECSPTTRLCFTQQNAGVVSEEVAFLFGSAFRAHLHPPRHEHAEDAPPEGEGGERLEAAAQDAAIFFVAHAARSSVLAGRDRLQSSHIAGVTSPLVALSISTWEGSAGTLSPRAQ